MLRLGSKVAAGGAKTSVNDGASRAFARDAPSCWLRDVPLRHQADAADEGARRIRAEGL